MCWLCCRNRPLVRTADKEPVRNLCLITPQFLVLSFASTEDVGHGNATSRLLLRGGRNEVAMIDARFLRPPRRGDQTPGSSYFYKKRKEKATPTTRRIPRATWRKNPSSGSRAWQHYFGNRSFGPKREKIRRQRSEMDDDAMIKNGRKTKTSCHFSFWFFLNAPFLTNYDGWNQSRAWFVRVSELRSSVPRGSCS